jgi:hypothetical protein
MSAFRRNRVGRGSVFGREGFSGDSPLDRGGLAGQSLESQLLVGWDRLSRCGEFRLCQREQR